jgi:hypothetical protein
MRPQSVLMFERLFLASLAGSLLGFVLTYDEIMGALANDPALREIGLGSGFILGVTAGGYALYLLLWYLIAYRASNVAKWILVVFTVIGVLAMVPSLAGPWGAMQLLSLAVCALEVAAVVYLFRADAVAWLKGEAPPDPAAFD